MRVAGHPGGKRDNPAAEETGLPIPDTLELRRRRRQPDVEPDFAENRLDTSSIDVTEVSERRLAD